MATSDAAAAAASYLALVKAQQAAQQQAERQILALVLTAARSFTGWYDTAAITGWATHLASLVESVQRVLARSTDSYLARSSSALTGRRVRPVGAVDVTSLRSGVSHAGVYGRVADQYRYQASRLAQPDAPDAASLVSAERAATNRAQSVALMDALLPVRAQAQAFMEEQPTIVGYRRVIHPEMSTGGTCGLCIAASDRLYKVAELMPVHDRCHCLPIPVYDGRDPGSILNEGDLSRLYTDAGGKTYGGSLKRTRYRIVDHGEIGPTLVRADADPRTPADVQRDERS